MIFVNMKDNHTYTHEASPSSSYVTHGISNAGEDVCTFDDLYEIRKLRKTTILPYSESFFRL